MLSVSMRRSLATVALLAPLSVFSRSAFAQNVVIVRPNADGTPTVIGRNALIQTALPISDATLRDLIGRYEPEALSGDAEATIVTLVLDNANNYVKSAARAAKVIRAEPGQIVSLGDDSSGVVRVRRIGGDDTPVQIGANAVAISTFKRADILGEPNGVLGTGIDAAEVEAITTKRYAPGTLAKGQLIVTVLRLK